MHDVIIDKLAHYCMDKLAADAMTRALRKGLISLSDVGAATKKLGLKPRKLVTLGRGAEGVANLMSDPKHGLSVWKVYNPLGNRYSNQLFSSKLRTYMRLKGNPLFAKFRGAVGRHPVTMHEYVQPVAGETAAKVLSPDYIKSRLALFGGRMNVLKKMVSPSVRNAIHGDGFISDMFLNPGNTIMTGKGPRIVDFMVSKQGKTPPVMHMKDALKSTGKNILHPKRIPGIIKSIETDALKQMGPTLTNRQVEAAAFNYNRHTKSFTPKFKAWMRARNIDPSSTAYAADLV